MVAVQEVVFSRLEVNFLVHLQSLAHSHAVVGDPEVLTVPLVTDTYNYPILREEVEAAPGRAGTGRRRCRDKCLA